MQRNVKCFILWTFFNLVLLNAQDNIGIKYFGLSIHPKGEKENAHLMPYKLDKYGYFVLNLGMEFMYEKFFYKDIFSIKFVQALYADCALQLGGFTHIGIRGKIVSYKKNFLYGGIGPTLIYRRNWSRLPNYVNLHRFKGKETDKWQWLFLLYAGEFEYKYFMSEKWSFSVSFVPGYPDLINLACGLNLNLN